MIPPLTCRWDGEALIPSHRIVADRHLVVGERYVLVEHQERSRASHNHEFAWVAEAWANLPEAMAIDFPTPDHLRKRALIEAGYYHQTQVDAGSNAAALRFATFMKADDEFCVAVVRGSIAIKRVAESQSKRAMGAERFQASKTAIMEIIAEWIGVTPKALMQARAA